MAKSTAVTLNLFQGPVLRPLGRLHPGCWNKFSMTEEVNASEW